MTSNYKLFVTATQYNTKKVATFNINNDDFTNRFGKLDSSQLNEQINRGSTLGNRVNCQFTYWYLNNNLIPGTEATVIDPNGSHSDESDPTPVSAKILIVNETKDKNGNSITAVLVDTWVGSRLTRVYVYYWLSDDAIQGPHSDNVLRKTDCLLPDLWKKCFNSEEDAHLFINKVDEKLTQLRSDGTLVMNDKEELHKFY